MLSSISKTRVAAVIFLFALGFGGGLWFWVSGRGFSAREKPSSLESFFARKVRYLATPPDARTLRNPVPLTAEALRSARLHFADHCASCHANDGSGETDLGQGLYPPAPDMRLAETQDLTDGELFYIIDNGIRFTGMPGWGTGDPEGEKSTWELFHFIRKLSELTDEELEEMRQNNPRNPQEVLEEDAVRRFLEEEPSSATDKKKTEETL